tara:strand:+ start:34486 stop:34977 length:492 start_codon:yes stop_codon:yes gene_type:complete
MSIVQFTPDYLAALVDEAAQSTRARQHRNIHTSYDDPCQRFMNAIGEDSYIRPHCHQLDSKTETVVAIRGLFAFVVFDDDGNVDDVIRFGSERFSDDGALAVGVDVTPRIWHTIIALAPGSILLELKAGPYKPDAAKEPAPWAPEEQTPEGERYLSELKALIR